MGFRHCTRRDNEGLNDPQKEFCHRYCVHFDRGLAYQEVYGFDINAKTARANGNNLFKKQRIVNYVESILRERRQSVVEINVDELITELKAIAFIEIDKVEMLEPGEVLTVKMADKQKAITTLLQISGYSSDINQAIRTLETFGVRLRQDEDGKWRIED